MTSEPIDYVTGGGITVKRTSFADNYATAIDNVLSRVDMRRGAVFSSNYEYPGRYTRWDTAIVDPPLGIESRDRVVEIIAYNRRGATLLGLVRRHLEGNRHIASMVESGERLTIEIVPAGELPV